MTRRKRHAHKPRFFERAAKRLPYEGLQVFVAYGIKPLLAVLVVWLYVMALSLLGSGPSPHPAWY